MIEWLILLYQIRSSSVVRNVKEWKSLNRLSIILSNTQISIAIHNIGPLYQLLCFVSINDPSYVQLMYNMCLITVHTHFKTIFAGLLIHFQLWMIEIEPDLDITPITFPSSSILSPTIIYIIITCSNNIECTLLLNE